MTNPKTVHQIWVGSPVPARENAWTDSVKQWCNNCKIQHKLWNLNELREQYTDEPIWEFSDTLPGNVRKWVLLCDYFRFIVVNPGDMYLDTDFLCNYAPSISVDNGKLMNIGEYWDGSKAATGMFCVGENFAKLDELKEAVREQAKTLTIDSLNDLCAALGPLFYRSTCGKLGIEISIVDRHQASHIQWKNRAALVHQGAGSWV